VVEEKLTVAIKELIKELFRGRRFDPAPYPILAAKLDRRVTYRVIVALKSGVRLPFNARVEDLDLTPAAFTADTLHRFYDRRWVWSGMWRYPYWKPWDLKKMITVPGDRIDYISIEVLL
jgi:hypothetical protein